MNQVWDSEGVRLGQGPVKNGGGERVKDLGATFGTIGTRQMNQISDTRSVKNVDGPGPWSDT